MGQSVVFCKRLEVGDISTVFLSSLPVCLFFIYVTANILWQNVTLTYCPTSDRISVSWPIWMKLFCSQPEPWQNIHGPDPMSHCSDRTSAAPFLYTATLPSSAPVFLCCLERCPHSWERQDQRMSALKTGKSMDNKYRGSELENTLLSPHSIPPQARKTPAYVGCFVRSSYIFLLFFFLSYFCFMCQQIPLRHSKERQI